MATRRPSFGAWCPIAERRGERGVGAARCARRAGLLLGSNERARGREAKGEGRGALPARFACLRPRQAVGGGTGPLVRASTHLPMPTGFCPLTFRGFVRIGHTRRGTLLLGLGLHDAGAKVVEAENDATEPKISGAIGPPRSAKPRTRSGPCVSSRNAVEEDPGEPGCRRSWKRHRVGAPSRFSRCDLPGKGPIGRVSLPT